MEDIICKTLDPLQRKMKDGFITYMELKLTALELGTRYGLTLLEIWKIWYNHE